MNIEPMPGFPWLFQVESRTKTEPVYIVNLRERNFQGSCECKRNRLSKLQCAHIRACREEWWADVAPRYADELARLN